MNVGPVVSDVHRVILYADVFQHVFQAYAGPLRAADRARGPLVARGWWYELAAAVATALELQLVGVVFEFIFELANRQCYFLLD